MSVLKRHVRLGRRHLTRSMDPMRKPPRSRQSAGAPPLTAESLPRWLERAHGGLNWCEVGASPCTTGRRRSRTGENEGRARRKRSGSGEGLRRRAARAFISSKVPSRSRSRGVSTLRARCRRGKRIACRRRSVAPTQCVSPTMLVSVVHSCQAAPPPVDRRSTPSAFGGEAMFAGTCSGWWPAIEGPAMACFVR